MVLTSLAGTIETLFAGWELVGLSSALLVAFFQERPCRCATGCGSGSSTASPTRRCCWPPSCCTTSAARATSTSCWAGGSWPEGVGHGRRRPGARASGCCCCGRGGQVGPGAVLRLAAAGDGRADARPAPSSTGRLSVHLGAFLLLRGQPAPGTSPWLCGLVVVAGAGRRPCTPTWCGSVQTDIKSALSFASLAQVGLIVAEIGLGFRYVALVHLLGNACLRTLPVHPGPDPAAGLQPLENAIGSRLKNAQEPLAQRQFRIASAPGCTALPWNAVSWIPS